MDSGVDSHVTPVLSLKHKNFNIDSRNNSEKKAKPHPEVNPQGSLVSGTANNFLGKPVCNNVSIYNCRKYYNFNGLHQSFCPCQILFNREQAEAVFTNINLKCTVTTILHCTAL